MTRELCKGSQSYLLFTCFIMLAVSAVYGSGKVGPVYRSKSYVLFPDHVQRGGMQSKVLAETGEVVSNGKGGSVGKSVSWKPSNDLTAYPDFWSGYPIVDAVYKMAVDDCIKCIGDTNLFNASAGRPPWVRDASYVALLSSQFIFPEITRNTLEATIHSGGTVEPEQLYATYRDYITPTICYTLSDFIVWHVAAWEYVRVTGDLEFLEQRYDEMSRTIAFITAEKFDPIDFLYAGGAFGDGHSAYPEGHTGFVPMKGSSTNMLHYMANMSMFELGGVLEKPLDERLEYLRRAYALKDSINEKLWLNTKQYYAFVRNGHDDRIPERTGALAGAFPILFNVANNDRKLTLLDSMPDSEWGTPCVWPINGNRFMYHDQTTWPFSESFWAIANAKMGRTERLMKGIASLTQMAALELTFKEMIGLHQGNNRGRDYQLWSAAGYLGMIMKGLFGMEGCIEGLVIEPTIPSAFANGISLRNFKYRDAVLDIEVTGSGIYIDSFLIDGEAAINFVPADLSGRHKVAIHMKPDSVFGKINYPETVCHGSEFSVKIAEKSSKAKYVLYLRDSLRGKPRKVDDTKVDLSQLEGWSNSVSFMVVSEDKEGNPDSMSRWHDIDIRPALEARFKLSTGFGFEKSLPYGLMRLVPRASPDVSMIFDGPVADNRKIDLLVQLQNNTSGTVSTKLDWELPSELKLHDGFNEIKIGSGSTKEIAVKLKPTRLLDYGSYPLSVKVSGGETEIALQSSVHIIGKIDLRGTWMIRHSAENMSAPSLFDSNFSGWDFIKVPNEWETLEKFKSYDGKLWFRRHILIPADWEGHDLEFYAYRIRQKDVTYFNGHQIGSTTGYKTPRCYKIPTDIVRAGEDNVIAISVDDLGLTGGLDGWPLELRVQHSE